MRRIIIKEARPGMRAARAVADPGHPDAPCVPSGDILTMAQIIQMHELGTYDLWINDPGLEFFDDVCSSQPTTAQLRLAEALRDSFLRLSAHISRTVFRRYEIILAELIHSLTRSAPSVPCFVALTEDPALLAHSCDTCAVASLLGLQLETYLIDQRRRLSCRQARDILNLALGALFHDIGELMLPAHQRESKLDFSASNDPTGDAFGEAWKQHTDEGFAAVQGRLDPSAAVVVQHHHQHFDGSGFGIRASGQSVAERAARPGARPHKDKYTGAKTGGAAVAAPPKAPMGQSGTSIHVYTRIATMADIFCHLLYAGDARIPQPVIKTLFALQQAPLRKWFDPIVLQALLALVPPFSEGTVVMLNDRQQAVVTKLDPNFPCCPQVRMLGSREQIAELQLEGVARGGISMATSAEVRLADSPGVEIAAADGADVSEFLYGPRPGRTLAA